MSRNEPNRSRNVIAPTIVPLGSVLHDLTEPPKPPDYPQYRAGFTAHRVAKVHLYWDAVNGAWEWGEPEGISNYYEPVKPQPAEATP